MSFIKIGGIETHNLKNIDVVLEKNAINLILGPSGSGKSSLAYDTIAQIGQNEFMSLFSDDAVEANYRVKNYENMLVTVPIKQINNNHNLRSTIGTYFGLNRMVALIFSFLTGADEEHFVLNKVENNCEICHGLGYQKALDVNKIINYEVPLSENPFRCWNRYKDFYKGIIRCFCVDNGIDINKNFRQLSLEEKNLLLYGESVTKYSVSYRKNDSFTRRTSKYYGLMSNKPMIPKYVVSSKFYSDVVCEHCGGKRYSENIEQYEAFGMSIGKFMTTPFSKIGDFLDCINLSCRNSDLSFSIDRLKRFIEMCVENNLGHLFFHRSIPTLSGGELQRLRLVQLFNTRLSDFLIILDEPLAGLSGTEKLKIYDNILKLSKKHTMVIVDHSDVFASKAKKIYVLGHGSGKFGGNIIETSAYLQSQKFTRNFNSEFPTKFFHVQIDGSIYSYKGVDIIIGENALNLVYGRSGIGKSTLIREYFPQYFDSYVYISQKSLLGNVNSSVATLLGVFSDIIGIYAKKYNKSTSFFSNQTGCEGSCKMCGGTGRIEYNIGDDKNVKIMCRDCQGTGFSKNLLKYKVSDKSILDIWLMTVNEACVFFKDKSVVITKRLLMASDLLLSHLLIGQPTSTLSGGENIRIKILKGIKSSAKVLGIDEPFKGLNPNEIFSVVSFLERLRMNGKTVIVVDHVESAFDYFTCKTELSVKDSIICGLGTVGKVAT